MGKVLLCTGSVAENPYYLKKPGISVYSVEELCYCFREHTFFIDEEIVNRELTDWLDRECRLPKLASALYGFLSKKGSASAFAATILEYTGYCPKEEILKIERFLRANAGLDETKKRKVMADYLAEKGRYQDALDEYRVLLEEIPKEEEAERSMTLASVYHNMGRVCAGLFLFEEASEYFKKAADMAGFEESRLEYLTCLRLFMEEADYVAFVAGNEEFYEDSLALEKIVEQAEEAWKESLQGKEWAEIESFHDENIGKYCETLEKKTELYKERYREMVKES